jgi:hypothetical protein
VRLGPLGQKSSTVTCADASRPSKTPVWQVDMSATIDRPLTVIQARQLLRDTSRVPEDRVAEAERVVRAFYAQKPRRQCFACPSGVWSEHETRAGDDVVWACARCHTSADLTREEIRDQQAERHAAQQAAAKTAEAAAASAPKPRDVLRERLQVLATARSELQRLEAAVPAARSRVWACQAAVEAAEAAAAAVAADAASGLAEALTTGKTVGPSSAGAKARAELANAVDAAVVAKNGRVILESRLTEAKSAVAFAMDKVRKSCLQVIADEKMSDLLGSAIAGRAQYLESIGQLSWLLRSHAVDDAGVRQFVNEASTAPSTWPEAATAGASACETEMNALLASADAVI